MTLLLTNEDVERALTMRDCIDVLERAYPELGEGVGVSRTVSQIFTPTNHSKDALYSFKSMDGVAPFAEIAAIRLTSEILTWPKDASGRAKKVRIGAAPNGRFIGLVLLFSTKTGEPLAILPDGVMQRMRVAATTGLAAHYLARKPECRAPRRVRSGNARQDRRRGDRQRFKPGRRPWRRRRAVRHQQLGARLSCRLG
jgi:alanine dehydrogenase